MKKRKWGRIINICSAHSLRASPFKSAYVAAKHGLAGFTKTVALELAEHGVTANAISPGLRVDAAGGEADPRSRQVGEHHARSRPRSRCCRGSRPTSSSRWSRSRRSRRFLASEAAASITGANYFHRRRLDRAIARVRSVRGYLRRRLARGLERRGVLVGAPLLPQQRGGDE